MQGPPYVEQQIQFIVGKLTIIIVQVTSYIFVIRSVRFSALGSKSGQRTRHAHLVGGVELPQKGSNNTKESNSYKTRGLYKIYAIN